MLFRSGYYHGVFGVNPAVDEFAERNNYKVNVTKEWFGTWYFTSQESTFKASITDGTANIQTFDATLGALPCDPGHYPYIIWNKITALPNQPAYFVGYEFTVS